MTFVAGVLVILAGAVGVVWYVIVAPDPNVAFNNATAALATLAIVTGFVNLLWRHYRGEPDASGIAPIDRLAESLGAQWREEVANRRIHSPGTIELRWRPSSKHMPGGLERVRTASTAALDPPPIPGATALDDSWDDRAHGMEQLHAFYAGLPHGRLVILGDAGTGKTSAMILLLLAALEVREKADIADRGRIPVPVMLSLADWNGIEPLIAFAARSIAKDHPFLRASSAVPDPVLELIKSGVLALFLDGFDEIAKSARPSAIQSLEKSLGRHRLRLVLTSHADAYESATDEVTLQNAAVVELLPIIADAARNYLARVHTHHGEAWARLARSLADTRSPLAEALDTPLMLSLLAHSYSARDDPSELMDVGRFPTAAAVERHLISQILPQAYGRQSASSRYAVPDARNWLGYIAHRMRTPDAFAGVERQVREFAWSQISEWVPTWLYRLVSSVLFAAVTGCAAWVVVYSSNLDPATLGGLAVLVPVVWAFGGGLSYAVGATWDSRVTGLPAVGLIIGVAVGALWGILGGLRLGFWLVPELPPVAGLATGLAVGVLSGIGLALAIVKVAMQNDRMRMRRVWPATFGRGSISVRNAVAVLALFGPFAVFAIPGSALPNVLLVGVGFLIAMAGDALIPARDTDAGPPSPRASLRQDFLAWSTGGLAVGASGGTVLTVFFGTGLDILPVWFAIGWLLTVLASHTSAYMLAVAYLYLTRRGPARPLRFLEDARNRRVLQRVGWRYEFRHGKLQDWLAEQYAGPADQQRQTSLRAWWLPR